MNNKSEQVTPIEPKPEITPGEAVLDKMDELGMPPTSLHYGGLISSAVLASRSPVSEEKAREVAKKLVRNLYTANGADAKVEETTKLLLDFLSVPNGISEEKARAMEDALKDGLYLACATLAFLGRDAGTPRIERTCDDLCKRAVEVEKSCRAALSSSVTQAPGWVSNEDDELVKMANRKPIGPPETRHA